MTVDMMLSKTWLRWTLTILAIIGIALCIPLFVPVVRETIIDLTERFVLHRKLTNPDHWRLYLSKDGVVGIVLMGAALFLIWNRRFIGIIKSYGIFIFLAMQLVFLMPAPGVMDAHARSSFLLSYRQGFSSRMLIGTIVDLIAAFHSRDAFVSKMFIWVFVIVSSLCFAFFVSRAIGALLKSVEPPVKKPSLWLIALYLTCPVAPSAYFIPGNFGRMDVYVFIFMLAILASLDTKRLRWTIPILCFMELASHLVVIFFYIPLVCVLLLYHLFQEKENTSLKRLLAVTLSVIVLSFLYFVFFSKRTLVYPIEADYAAFLSSKTDSEGYSSSLHYDFFMSFNDTFKYAVSSIVKAFPLNSGCWSIIYTLPLFAAFAWFWKCCITVSTVRHDRIIFILSALLPLVGIPAFIFFIDWGRWLIMIFTGQYMLLFYFIHRNYSPVVEILNMIYLRLHEKYAKRRGILCLMAFIWFVMILIGPLCQITPSTCFMMFIRFIFGGF